MQFLIIFLPLLWLSGQLIAYKWWPKWKHHLLLGFIIYFALFNIVSLPFTILELSWKSYWYTQLIGHILLVLIIGYYYFYRYRLYRNWSLQQIKLYMIQYWPAYLVLIIYLTFAWMNTSTIFWTNHTGAVWDDYFYSAKALKSIGADHLYQQHFVYLNQDVQIQEKLVVWELFWAFMSTIFKMHTMTLAHKYIPVMVLTIFIFSFDEVVRVATTKKQSKYYILGLLIFVIFGYIQSELVKTLYMTWYGNVILATAFIPLVLKSLIGSLKQRNDLILLLILPLTFIGFSNGIVVFSGILYLIIGLIWLVMKDYSFKRDKLIYSVLTSIILIVLVGFSYKITRQFTLFNSVIAAPPVETEKDIFTLFFNSRLPLTMIAIFFFVLNIGKKQLSKHSLIVWGVPIFILFLGLIPIINNFLYNTLNFSFRRLLESVSIFLVIYIWVALLDETYGKIKWQYFAVALAIMSYFYAKTVRIYVLEVKRIYSYTAIMQPYKVHPLTVEIAEKLQSYTQNKNITVAFRSTNAYRGQHFNQIFSTVGATEEQHLHYDIGDAVVGLDKHVYLYKYEDNKFNIRQLKADQVDYLVTDNQFLLNIVKNNHDGNVVETITHDTLNSPIYIIKLK